MTRSLCLAVGAAPLICTFPRENSTATKWCVSTSRLASGPGWQRCQTNPIRTAMECLKADDLTRHSTSKAASLSLEDSIPGVLNELLKENYELLLIIVIFLNFNSRTDKHKNDLWEFKVDSNTWVRLNPSGKGPSPRRRQAFCLVVSRALLFTI